MDAPPIEPDDRQLLELLERLADAWAVVTGLAELVVEQRGLPETITAGLEPSELERRLSVAAALHCAGRALVSISRQVRRSDELARDLAAHVSEHDETTTPLGP